MGCWALSKLTRVQPLPPFESIKEALLILCEILASRNIQDQQTISDCSWSICSNLKKDHVKMQILIDSNVLPVIISNLLSNSLSVKISSLRSIQNISQLDYCSQSEIFFNLLASADFLQHLVLLLNGSKKVVIRQTCSTISNLIAKSSQFSELVLRNDKLLGKILEVFQTDSNCVKVTIRQIILDLAVKGQPVLVCHFYESTEIAKYYLELLQDESHQVIQNGFKCLSTILDYTQTWKQSLYVEIIAYLMKNLEQLLRQHKNHELGSVRRTTAKFVHKYFD